MDKKSSYKLWDTQDVSDWLTNQLKLPQYGKTFGKFDLMIC
jgi:hypothetical protein